MGHNRRVAQPYLGIRQVTILAQVLFFILLTPLIICYLEFDFQAESLIYLMSVFLVVLFIWSVWSWKMLTKSLFDPYILFLVAATLFNGGHAFLEVFHLNEKGILDGRFSSEILIKTLFLVIVGLISFHLGGLVSVATTKRTLAKKNVTTNKAATTQRVRRVGWILLCISFIAVNLLLKDALLVVLSSGYGALYQREVATGFGATHRVLATFLVPGALFLLAGSKGRWTGIGASGLIIFGYSALQFFLGSRSSAVMPLIAYAWVWHRCIRPLPKVVLIGTGMVILLVVFPLIRVVRSIAGEERFSFSFLVNTFLSIDNPLVKIISEMGGSMMTVAHTIDLVPRVRDFDMGVGYLYALLTVIPNFFWDVHPTIARGLAGSWLTQTVAPALASRGRGYGFSFIAEAYLNFGWVGTFPTLGLIGFLIGKFVLWAQRSSEPAKMATIASFASFFLFYARGESGSIVRPLVWYALLPYLLVRLMSRFGRS